MNGFQKQKQGSVKLIIQANGYIIPDKNNNNSNNNNKPTIILPKLNENNQVSGNRNLRSLSPIENRRIKTSSDNILKKSLQIFPTSNKNQQNKSTIIDEHKPKRFKHPLKSAQINRNLYSGSKYRKSSEYINNNNNNSNININNNSKGSDYKISQRWSISTPNIPPNNNQKNLQINQQSPSNYLLPLINLRPPSKSTGQIVMNHSQKYTNFSLSAAQYYSAELENQSEQLQQQMNLYSTQQISSAMTNSTNNIILSTPEMNKKFSSKSNPTGKQLQPIFEEVINNNQQPTVNIKSNNLNQENNNQLNINFSPSIQKINNPLLTQQQQQQQLSSQQQNQQQLQQQQQQQLQIQGNQSTPYFFSNQNRQYLVRKTQKHKPKTVVGDGSNTDSVDLKLQSNYNDLLREKQMQQDSYNKSTQRYLQEMKSLREEKELLSQKLKEYENNNNNNNNVNDTVKNTNNDAQSHTNTTKTQTQKQQQQQECDCNKENENHRKEQDKIIIEKQQQLHDQIINLHELQYNELYMQLEILSDRIIHHIIPNTSYENHTEEIQSQFQSFIRYIQNIQQNQPYYSSNNNNHHNHFKSNSSIQPLIRFYPPHLIRFDHSQRLGKGGFCPVYKIQVGNQEMAQKIFEYDIEENSSIMNENLEGIFNEVKILLKVNTFNNQTFVKLHGISFDIRKNEMSGRDQFIFAIFMDLIGTYDQNRFLTCDLKKFIVQQRNKIHYSKRYLELALQIAEGIEVLYNNNIVHSDLKPQNILLDNQQNIKIIDFGTSKFNTKAYTYDTSLLGFTPRYCPLEHFDMERLTPTTDVWSFGCLLFEMVTGYEPWRGIKNLQDVRKALENKQSLWQHYVQQVTHNDTLHINLQVVELIKICTSYENRPHPSFVTEKINEILNSLSNENLKS